MLKSEILTLETENKLIKQRIQEEAEHIEKFKVLEEDVRNELAHQHVHKKKKNFS